MSQKTSPLSTLVVQGREFLIKRDELFDPYLSGNKYRKLHKLLHTPSGKYKTIISYGGTQSNAMLALAALCKEKKWHFIYYTKKIAQIQKEQTIGNFFQALTFGMEHRELENELYRDFIATLDINLDADSYLVHQGGADSIAREGLEVLAQEIREQNPDVKSVATPSGTGTTALYLALALKEYTVYTTPSIGDVAYLKEQMRALSAIPDNLVILEPAKKYHFAKPYKEFYEIYCETKEAGIEFDLLYAPSLWLTLLQLTREKILYVHSGGVSGNESMLERYKKKGFVSL